MVDAGTAWVMYAADYDTGRQHSRIIPDSVRVLRTSWQEISSGELQAERERTGLDRLHTIQIDVPPEISSENLAAYAERYISLEPGFDFWDDVIGDDIVVAGIAYDGDRYAPDGEGGVRPLTEAEQAAREATIRQREAERAAEQTAREEQRRRQAIDYATTTAAPDRPRSAVPPGHPHAALLRQLEDNPAIRAGLANYAIDRFLDHRRSGLDAQAARQEAAIEAATEYATAWRTIESGNPAAAAGTTAPPYAAGIARPDPQTELDGADDEVIVIDPRDVLPALPALRGFRLADNAIGQFVDHREAGLDTQAARQRAATVAAEAAPAAPETGSHQNTADQAAPAADSTRIQTVKHLSDLQERSAHLRSCLDTDAPGSGRSTDTWEAELEAADALADAPDWVRNGWPDPSEQELDVGP